MVLYNTTTQPDDEKIYSQKAYVFFKTSDKLNYNFIDPSAKYDIANTFPYVLMKVDPEEYDKETDMTTIRGEIVGSFSEPFGFEYLDGQDIGKSNRHSNLVKKSTIEISGHPSDFEQFKDTGLLSESQITQFLNCYLNDYNESNTELVYTDNKIRPQDYTNHVKPTKSRPLHEKLEDIQNPRAYMGFPIYGPKELNDHQMMTSYYLIDANKNKTHFEDAIIPYEYIDRSGEKHRTSKYDFGDDQMRHVIDYISDVHHYEIDQMIDDAEKQMATDHYKKAFEFTDFKKLSKEFEVSNQVYENDTRTIQPLSKDSAYDIIEAFKPLDFEDNLPDLMSRTQFEFIRDLNDYVGSHYRETVDENNNTTYKPLCNFIVRANKTPDPESNLRRIDFIGYETFSGDIFALEEPLPLEIPETLMKSVNTVKVEHSHENYSINDLLDNEISRLKRTDLNTNEIVYGKIYKDMTSYDLDMEFHKKIDELDKLLDERNSERDREFGISEAFSHIHFKPIESEMGQNLADALSDLEDLQTNQTL